MRRGRRALVSLALVSLALAVVSPACGKSESPGAPSDEPPTGPPPVTEAERERGVAACADYKVKVCACAERDPRLAGDCRMADSRTAALELSLRIAAAEKVADPRSAGDPNDSSRALAISNARKVMRRCIEQVAELARGCPTAPPAEATP